MDNVDFLYHVYLIIYSFSMVLAGCYFTAISDRDISKITKVLMTTGIDKEAAIKKANIIFYMTAAINIFTPVVNSTPLIVLFVKIVRNFNNVK